MTLETLAARAYLTRARWRDVMNPLKFIQGTRAEVAKIIWPTRREVIVTTIMVFIMATLTAIFFTLVDLGIRTALTGVIGIMS